MGEGLLSVWKETDLRRPFCDQHLLPLVATHDVPGRFVPRDRGNVEEVVKLALDLFTGRIPDVDQPNRYHTYGRVQRAPARVILFIRRDKGRQWERMQTSEHSFDTIKHCGGTSYFLCK